MHRVKKWKKYLETWEIKIRNANVNKGNNNYKLIIMTNLVNNFITGRN